MPKEESLIAYDNTGNLVSQLVTLNNAMKLLLQTLYLVTLQPFSLGASMLLKYSLGVSHLFLMYRVLKRQRICQHLEDNIRKQGAMDKLISDCASAETSNRIKDILWALVLLDW
jgi:hypothetical protein